MQKKITLLVVALLINVCNMNVSAAIYYAGPNGTSSGAGTEASPYDIRTAVNKLAAGDVLNLLDGQYDLGINHLDIKNSGTADKPITIQAVNARKAILDGRNEPYTYSGYYCVGINVSASHVHIKGIVVQYAGKNGVFCSGGYNTFENVESRYNTNSGFQMKSEIGYNLILNCDSHHNFDYENLNTDGTPDFGGDADGFADKQITGPGNTYRGCRSWMNSDDGWDSYQRVTSGNQATIYENCICYANGPATYDLSGNPRVTGVDKDWFTNSSNLGSKEKITAYTNCGNGNGFKIGGNGTAHNVILRRCLSVGHQKQSGVKGFDQNSDGGNIEIYNCTAYDNSSNYGFYNNKVGASLTIKNCISLSGNNTWSITPTTSDHNSWNTSGVTCSASDFQSTAYDDATMKTLTGDRQADGSIYESTFMHLRETSSMINAGTPVDGIEYKGKAPDLGCYETNTDASAACQLISIQFSNTAYGSINEPAEGATNGTIVVPYMKGETAPTVDESAIEVSTSATYKIIGNSITVTAEDKKSTKTYDITTQTFSPLDASNDIATTAFTETPSWIYCPYPYDETKGVRFAKAVNDASLMRISMGWTRQYYFITVAKTLTLTSGAITARPINVYLNGTKLSTPTTTVKSGSITINLSQTTNNMVCIESNQTSGDGGFISYAVTANGSSAISDVNADASTGSAQAQGKFIQNGKLVFVKDGKKYTVSGARLK